MKAPFKLTIELTDTDGEVLFQTVRTADDYEVANHERKIGVTVGDNIVTIEKLVKNPAVTFFFPGANKPSKG